MTSTINSSYYLAIALMLLGSTIMSLSSIVLKVAAIRMPAMEKQSLAGNLISLLRSPIWLGGVALSASAIIIEMSALGMAEMTILLPLSAFGLVILLLLARLVLKEKIEKQGIVGALLAIIGIVIVGVWSQPTQANVVANDLWAPFRTMPALSWIAILLAWLATSTIICQRNAYRGAGIIFAINTAVATVLSLAFAKGFFAMLLANRPSVATLTPASLLLAFLFISFSIVGLFYQQFALQKSQAVVVAPLISICLVAFPIPTGIFIFNEQVASMQLMGILFLAIAAWLLSKRRSVPSN